MTISLLSAEAASPQAQDQTPEGLVSQDDFSINQFDSGRSMEAPGSIAKLHAGAFSRAVRDPLSYAPAGVVGLAGSLDWASSQGYLRQGWLEANPRFTSNGLRNAEPVDTAAGYRRIVVREALPILATSIAINSFSYWMEQKGLGRLGRVLRWASAGTLAAASARSVRQWHRNQSGNP